MFEFRFKEKNQEMTLSLDEKIPPIIQSDEKRLYEVLTNLLGNATKFTPENGKLLLSVKRTDGEENKESCVLEFRVSDTGIGISKEQQEKLFKPFVQVDSGISRKYGGTGLGLVISKKIIEMMDGEIHIESEFGKGAVFIFTIKALIPELKQEEIIEEHLEEEIDYSGKEILIAEDVDINLEIISALLEPMGFTITPAEDGKKAYDIFSSSPEKFDLIFMDIHMPGMDGYESAQLIRKLESPYAKSVPIIAMTANVFQEDIDHCISVGMNSHIGKPIDFEIVKSVLREYLG
jgi:CheY-like chemotaxis protein